MDAGSAFRSVTKERLKSPVKIIFAGKGGQGVLTASAVTAKALILSGYDVKKSDVKGIARRGGKVLSTLAAGEKIFSPKVISETADIAVVMYPDMELKLSASSIVIMPSNDEIKKYRQCLNMFLTGILSAVLGLSQEKIEEAVRERFKDGILGINLSAFHDGRKSSKTAEILK